jgi:hypothetical protein
VVNEPTPHEVYVAKGYCPSIHDWKIWCAQQAGHGGQHFGLYLHQNGTFTVYPRWD